MDEPKVIQTTYKGIRYRSRTEARWAVFFEAAGIVVEYEQEGYVVGGEPYLPDFYARQLGAFFEVKGTDPTPDEIHKAQSLADETGRKVYFLIGSPREDGYLGSSAGMRNGHLALCRRCAGEWWAMFPFGYSAINPSVHPCDGKVTAAIEPIRAASNERFGVHD